jgi:hypothetical protein
MCQFCILLFADDCVLIGNSVDELQNIANHFIVFCTENDLMINPAKTKCMLVNCNGELFVNDV